MESQLYSFQHSDQQLGGGVKLRLYLCVEEAAQTVHSVQVVSCQEVKLMTPCPEAEPSQTWGDGRKLRALLLEMPIAGVLFFFVVLFAFSVRVSCNPRWKR